MLKRIFTDFKASSLWLQISIFIVILLGSWIRFFNLFNLGFYFDLVETQYEWGKSALEMGIVGFWANYPADKLMDYPVVSIIYEYCLAAIVSVWNLNPNNFVILLKLCNWMFEILAIFTVCFLIPKHVLKLKKFTVANYLVAGLIYILPSFWFVSAVWGQNDILLATISILSIFLLYLGKEYPNRVWYKNYHLWSGLLLALGIWIKQQPLLMLPIIFLFYLHGKTWLQLIKFSVQVLPYLVTSFFAYSTFSPQSEILFADVSNHLFILSLVSGSCFLALIHVLILLFINRNKPEINPFLYWLAGFLLLNNLIFQPFLWLSPERMLEVVFATAIRLPTVSNGASTFWEIVKLDNNAELPVFSFAGFNLSYSLAGLLIYLTLIGILIWKLLDLNFAKLKSFSLEQIYPKQINFSEAVLIGFVHVSTYFFFFTKMHSRYLHFSLLFGFLFLLLIWGKKSCFNWLVGLLFLNLGYFLNQLVVFSEENSEPIWVNNLTQAFNLNLYNLAAVIMLLAFFGMYNLGPKILKQS